MDDMDASAPPAKKAAKGGAAKGGPKGGKPFKGKAGKKRPAAPANKDETPANKKRALRLERQSHRPHFETVQGGNAPTAAASPNISAAPTQPPPPPLYPPAHLWEHP